jgi:hypothetical protein
MSGFHFLSLDTFLVVTQLASFSAHSLAHFDVLFTIDRQKPITATLHPHGAISTI